MPSSAKVMPKALEREDPHDPDDRESAKPRPGHADGHGQRSQPHGEDLRDEGERDRVVTEAIERGIEEDGGDGDVVSGDPNGVLASRSLSGEPSSDEEEAERSKDRVEHQGSSSSDPVDDEEGEDDGRDELDGAWNRCG